MTDPILAAFDLRRHPFTVDIDVEGLYQFAGFQQGLLRLENATRQRGSVLVTAEPGSGKTALIRAFVRRLSTSAFSVFEQLATPGAKNPARCLVEGFLAQLGEPVPFNNPGRSWSNLRRALFQMAEKNRTPVLVVDDVHHLTPQCWLALKSLMNFELDSKLPLLLVLLGAPETLRQLSFTSLEEVRDRLSCSYYLKALQENEIKPYLECRLKWAGARRPIFPEDVVAELGRSARGNPRRLNRLAGTSLMAAALQGRSLVDRECLEQAISELQFQAPVQQDI